MKISKKIIAIIISFTMLSMMILPGAVRAAEEAKEAEEVAVAQEAVTDISQIKLNTKIVFTGTLYRVAIPTLSQIMNKEVSTELVAKGKFTNQKALVTSLLKRSQGMVMVAFFPDGKEIPVFGYIKVAEAEIKNTNEKYISIKFDATNLKNGAAIVIDGEKYDLTAGVSNIEIANGGVNIDGNVVLIKDSVELVNFTGELDLDIANKAVSVGATLEITDKITVDGNAKLEIIDKGVAVSGDASVNGSEIGSGAAEVTYTGDMSDPLNVEITKASLIGKDFTATVNSLLQKIISMIKNLFSSLLSKVM